MMEFSHRRKNILTGEWIQVSPQRTMRPWQGKHEEVSKSQGFSLDPSCYLCPGNFRANGTQNPHYQDVYVFDNDFAALQSTIEELNVNENDLLIAQSEKGICKVLCFSPDHNKSLADLSSDNLIKVINAWQNEYEQLGKLTAINAVLIFENKGEIMGCSNPHPHGQIWAQASIPQEMLKEQVQQELYFSQHKKNLLIDYVNLELEKNERIVYQNDAFVVLVPYWAIWPFETLILPKVNKRSLLDLTSTEAIHFAEAISSITKIYDKVFQCSFPYSAGIHQAPTDGLVHEAWTFHMHFYPPLLRSETIKKFMVGYEMFGNPQRDFTPEHAANHLKNLV